MTSLTIGIACVLFTAAGDGKAEEVKLLQATLTSESGKVKVVLRNKTDKAVSVDKQTLESGILALDVFDAAGKRIPTIPPPIPRPLPEVLVIPAGGEHAQSYDLNFFSPALKPGIYLVRLGVKGWTSNDLKYVIEGK